MASPGRYRSALVVTLVAAPMLLLAADVVGMRAAHPLEGVGGHDAWNAQHVLLLLGTAAMIPALLALMTLAEERSPRLALTGAALGIGGLLAVVSVLSLDFAAVQVAEFGDLAAMRALYTRILDGPIVSVLDGLQVALPLGIVLLGVVLLGHRRVRRVAVLALLASAALSGPALPVAVSVAARLLLLAALLALARPATAGGGPASTDSTEGVSNGGKQVVGAVG